MHYVLISDANDNNPPLRRRAGRFHLLA